jgi:hypothetical protein
MAREHCNDLCSKATTGTCALCDKLDERDRFEKYFWRFFCKEFYLTLHDFVFRKTFSFIIFVALVSLIGSVYQKFLDKGDFSSVLAPYLAITALSIALASMTFTYSRTKDDKEEKMLVYIGELFINTALALVFALLASWLCFEIQTFLKKISYYKTFETPLLIIIGFGNGGLLAAALNFHRGIINIQKYVGSRARGKL